MRVEDLPAREYSCQVCHRVEVARLVPHGWLTLQERRNGVGRKLGLLCSVACLVARAAELSEEREGRATGECAAMIG